MKTARLLNILIRAFGVMALVLGLAMWLGYGRSLTPWHIRFGIGLVLSLWVLAGMAGWNRAASAGPIVFAATWGLVTWIFGVMQNQMLPEAFHWVVEIAHLVVGAVAIGAGSRLANAMSVRRGPSRT